jgi:hypothetical protein
MPKAEDFATPVASPLARVRAAHVAAAAPLLAAACAILAVRALLGFQFPVPWPDETSFLAPAFALSHAGSLFDPGLNPDRIVMWMPPGYAVVLAGIFSLFGYSFALARWVSALFCLASLGVTAWIAGRLVSGWRLVLACWLVGAAFLSPAMLMDANIARMDTLVACLALAALAAILAGRVFVALAIAAAGMTVHFNAGYFCLGGALVLADAWRRGVLPRPGTHDVLAWAAALLALGLYALHVLRNWGGFRTDMAFQFALKRFVATGDAAHPLWPVLAAGALAALAAWRARGLDRAAACALFGALFVLMAHSGHELWNDFGQPLGFALIAIGLLSGAPGWYAAPALAAAGLTVAMAVHVSETMQSLLPRLAMLHRSVVAPDDIAKVRRFIATLPPGTTVNFGGTGLEPFFFAGLARAGAHWTLSVHSVTQPMPLRTYDWRVRCDSSEWPRVMLRFDVDYPRQGRDTGCDIIRVKPAAAAP